MDTASRRQAQAENAQGRRININRESQKTSFKFANVDADVATEFARTCDIVNWLVTHPAERGHLTKLVREIEQIADRVLRKYPGEDDRKRVAQRLADHVWCDIAAGIVVTIRDVHQVEQLRMDAREVVATTTSAVVHRSRASSHGYRPSSAILAAPPLTRSERDHHADLVPDTLEHATDGVVKATFAVFMGEYETFDSVLFELRVLAVLLCPDPSAHKLIWDNCLAPLLRGPISSALQQRLTTLVKGLCEPLSWDT